MSRLPSLLISLGLMSLSKKGQIKRFDSWLDFFFLSLTVSGAGLLHWRRRCIEMATNWLLDLYDSQQHSAWCCQKPKTRRKTSLTFRIVILLRHVPSVPARRLSNQPPRTRLHKGATETKSNYLTVLLFFRLHPSEGCLSASYQNVRPLLE